MRELELELEYRTFSARIVRMECVVPVELADQFVL